MNGHNSSRSRASDDACVLSPLPQHRTRRVREEGGSAGNAVHNSVTTAVLGLLLHGDAVGAGGEVRLVLRREPRRGGTTKQLLLLRAVNVAAGGHAGEDLLDAGWRDGTDALDCHRQTVRPPVQVASSREDRLPSRLRHRSAPKRTRRCTIQHHSARECNAVAAQTVVHEDHEQRAESSSTTRAREGVGAVASDEVAQRRRVPLNVWLVLGLEVRPLVVGQRR